jgi:RNA polymerase sigma-70 factor (ECF subfamily)
VATVTDDRVVPDEGPEATSSTLLVRVKAGDQEAWRRFVYLYGPLVYRWCKRSGLQDADADDVRQDVFRTLAGSIDGFRHDRKGDSLRGWLWTVTRTRVLDLLRRRGAADRPVGGSDALAALHTIPDPLVDAESTEEDQNVLVHRAVEMVLDGCKAETRQAFLRVVAGGESPAEVARDLGMTANAVYLAKSHTLRRLREEFGDLLDL